MELPILFRSCNSSFIHADKYSLDPKAILCENSVHYFSSPEDNLTAGRPLPTEIS